MPARNNVVVGAAAFQRADSEDRRAGLWAELGLECDAKGRPHANTHNTARILRGHPEFAGHIWFDEFHQRIRTDTDGVGARSWDDADDVRVLDYLQGEVGIHRVGLDHVRQAVLLVARENRKHEVRDWLTGCRWDDTPVLDQLAVKGFGADDSDYSRQVCANLIKSMVARARRPGCQADAMVVLEGPQGSGKSSVVKAIGGRWSSEQRSSFSTKDAVQELAGKWLIEMAELDSMSRHEVETTKAFISRCVDTIRPSYGRHPIDLPRSCIFVGTTNERSYLRDATGARRFWPLRCGAIDLEWINKHREAMFAEALYRVGIEGESWWEVPLDEATRQQDARYEGDPWSEPIDLYLVSRDTATMLEILTEAVRVDVGRQGKAEQMRAAKILRRMGWERSQTGTTRHRVWQRPQPRDGASGSPVVRPLVPYIQSPEPQEPLELPIDKRGT